MTCLDRQILVKLNFCRLTESHRIIWYRITPNHMIRDSAESRIESLDSQKTKSRITPNLRVIRIINQILKSLQPESRITNRIWNSLLTESRIIYADMIRDSVRIIWFGKESYDSSDTDYNFITKYVNLSWIINILLQIL